MGMGACCAPVLKSPIRLLADALPHRTGVSFLLTRKALSADSAE
jgi:hypothetical protein